MKIKRFLKQLMNAYIANGCLTEAGSLTLTSLLAVVPLASVFLSLFSALPFFDSLMKPVENLIFANFIPATGEVIQKYVAGFSAKASQMSTLSVVLLFVTSVLLLNSIATTINKIGGTTQRRTFANALMLYWSILSLGPVFVGLSIGASAYILSAQYVLNYNVGFLIDAAPFVFSWLGLTFIYFVIPNQKVKLGFSLCAAFIAALFIDIAKRAFAYYFSANSSYEAIYGAFASIPLFIIWLYWVWCIVLFGTALNHTLHTFSWHTEGKCLKIHEQLLVWLIELDSSSLTGDALQSDDLAFNVSEEQECSKAQLLSLAMAAKLIQQTADGGFLLSKKLSAITFEDICVAIFGSACQYDEQALVQYLPTLNSQVFTQASDKSNLAKRPLSDIIDQ